MRRLIEWVKAGLAKPTEPYCPVCGYYCLGRGGMECIDKPMIIAKTRAQNGKNQ